MKNRYVYIILMVCSFTTLHAQVWKYAHRFQGIKQNYTLTKTIEDASGHLLVYGEIKDDSLRVSNYTLKSRGDADAFLFKMTSSGQILWARTFGSPYIDGMGGICTDEENSIYIHGTFSDSLKLDHDTLVSKFGYRDVFIMKLDSNGQEVWAISGGGHYHVSSGRQSGGLVVSGSDLYVAGNFSSYGGSPPIKDTMEMQGHYFYSQGNGEVFLLKMDKSTGVILDYTTLGSKLTDVIENLYIDSDKNIVFSLGFGTSQFVYKGDTVNDANARYIYPIVKMDSAFNLILVSPLFDMDNFGLGINDIAFDSHHNIYFAGGMQTNHLRFGGFHLYKMGITDFFVGKMDSQGNPLWIKRGGGYMSDWAGAIRVIDDNHIAVLGSVTQYAFYETDTVASPRTGSGLYDTFILDIDSDGAPLQMELVGLGGPTTPTYMFQNKDDDLIVTGYTGGHSLTFGSLHLPDTTRGPSMYIFCRSGDLLTDVEVPSESGSIKIYPNPAKDQCTVVRSENNGKWKVEVYSITGQRIHSVLSYKSHIQLPTALWPAGVYMLDIYDGEQNKTSKILEIIH